MPGGGQNPNEFKHRLPHRTGRRHEQQSLKVCRTVWYISSHTAVNACVTCPTLLPSDLSHPSVTSIILPPTLHRYGKKEINRYTIINTYNNKKIQRYEAALGLQGFCQKHCTMRTLASHSSSSRQFPQLLPITPEGLDFNRS